MPLAPGAYQEAAHELKANRGRSDSSAVSFQSQSTSLESPHPRIRQRFYPVEPGGSFKVPLLDSRSGYCSDDYGGAGVVAVCLFAVLFAQISNRAAIGRLGILSRVGRCT